MKQTSLTEMFRDITETDVYNFSMAAGAKALYPKALAKSQVIDRSGADYPKHFVETVKEKLQDASKIQNDKKYNAFLKDKWPFLPKSFFPWLQSLKLDSQNVNLWKTETGRLSGEVIGPWADNMPFEQITLGCSTQTFNELKGFMPDANWEDKLVSKIQNLKRHGVVVSEFGLRRRAFHWMQDRVNQLLFEHGGLITNGGIFAGSSSPFHCFPYGVSPKGTVGHLWPEFHSAKFGIENANLAALMAWRAVYGDNLGTALTDTFTSDYFWMTLPPVFAQMIKSYRQDSGDPFLWTDHAYRYFNHHAISTSDITLMYTDSLDDEKAIKIQEYANNLGFKAAFGLGGFFTNNKLFFEHTPDYKPMNLVVKLVAISLDNGVSWIPTAKLSDVVGKTVGDEKTVKEYQLAASKYPFNL